MRPINIGDRLRRRLSVEARAARASAAECEAAGAPAAAVAWRRDAEVLDRQVVRARGEAHAEDRRWRLRDPDGYQARQWLACEFVRLQADARSRRHGGRGDRARSGAGMVM